MLTGLTGGGNEARAAEPTAEKFLGLVQIPTVIDTSYPDGPPESKMNSGFIAISVYAKPDTQAPVVTELRRQNQVATREYAYERNAAVVLDKKEGWYLIALSPSGLKVGPQPDRGWIQARFGGSFFSFSELLEKSPFMTPDWNNIIYKTPASAHDYHSFSSAFSENGTQSKADVNVLDHQTVAGELWIEIQILGNGRCAGLKPKEVDRGWVPAFSKAGRLNIDYNPRGCPGH